MFLHDDASDHDDASGRSRLLSSAAAGTTGKNPVPLRRKTC
jgi:hypothetical protein